MVFIDSSEGNKGPAEDCGGSSGYIMTNAGKKENIGKVSAKYACPMPARGSVIEGSDGHPACCCPYQAASDDDIPIFATLMTEEEAQQNDNRRSGRLLGNPPTTMDPTAARRGVCECYSQQNNWIPTADDPPGCAAEGAGCGAGGRGVLCWDTGTQHVFGKAGESKKGQNAFYNSNLHSTEVAALRIPFCEELYSPKTL